MHTTAPILYGIGVVIGLGKPYETPRIHNAGGMAGWPLAAHAQLSMPVIGYGLLSRLKFSERGLAQYRKGLAALFLPIPMMIPAIVILSILRI